MPDTSVLQTVIQTRNPPQNTVLRPLTMTPNPGVEDEVLGNDPHDLEAILGVLVENTPVAMAMFDRQMRYLLANRQWVTDFGLQHEMPLVGRSQFEVLPNLHSGWRGVYDRALQGHVVRNEHDVMQDPTGKPVIFRWEVRPWRTGNDAHVGGLMVTCEKFAPIMITQDGTLAEASVPVQKADREASPPRNVQLPACELPVMELDFDGVIHQANDAASRIVLARGLQEGITCLWEAFGNTDAQMVLKREVIEALAKSMGSDGMEPASFVTPFPGGDTKRVIRWAVTNAPEREGEPRALVVGVIYDDVAAPAAPALQPLPVEPVAPVAAPTALSTSAAVQNLEAAFAAERRKLADSLAAANEEKRQLQEIEQVYKRRELRQREVLDTMPCGLIVLDERGRPIFHNAHVRDLFGRELNSGDAIEDWLGKACLNATHRDEITRIWRESIWRRQLTKIVSLTTSDGLLKDLEFRPAALPNHGLLVTIHDVTDASRLEEMLRSAEAKFRTLLHDSPVAAVLTDGSGAIFEANNAAERLLCRSRNELRRTGIDDWLSHESVQARRAAFARLVSGAQLNVTMPVEVNLGAKTDLLAASLKIASINDTEGKFHAAAHFLEPIAHAMVAAPQVHAGPLPAALPPVEEIKATTVSVPRWQAILRANSQGRILAWSPAAEELFGCTSAEATKRWLHQFFRPSDATGFQEELQTRLASPTQTFEWNWFGANGRKGRTAFNVRMAEGDVIELLVCSQAMEAPPAPQRAVAPAPAPAMSFVVGSPSMEAWPLADLDRERLMLTETHHRIKNHLQLISSLLNLQGNSMDEGLARQALRSSQNRVRAIAALHQHLYQLSLGQTVSLQDFTDDLVARLRECYDIPASRVGVTLHLREIRMREEWVMPMALILNEALANCFKHAYPNGRQGKIEVSLTTDGDFAHLIVQDDGVGLPEGFDPAANLGLGLKVIGVFAEQMRGKLHLKNIVYNGLFFDLQFPIGCVDI